jgi:hypothetical protein
MPQISTEHPTNASTDANTSQTRGLRARCFDDDRSVVATSRALARVVVGESI